MKNTFICPPHKQPWATSKCVWLLFSCFYFLAPPFNRCVHVVRVMTSQRGTRTPSRSVCGNGTHSLLAAMRQCRPGKKKNDLKLVVTWGLQLIGHLVFDGTTLWLHFSTATAATSLPCDGLWHLHRQLPPCTEHRTYSGPTGLPHSCHDMEIKTQHDTYVTALM